MRENGSRGFCGLESCKRFRVVRALLLLAAPGEKKMGRNGAEIGAPRKWLTSHHAPTNRAGTDPSVVFVDCHCLFFFLRIPLLCRHRFTSRSPFFNFCPPAPLWAFQRATWRLFRLSINEMRRSVVKRSKWFLNEARGIENTFKHIIIGPKRAPCFTTRKIMEIMGHSENNRQMTRNMAARGQVRVWRKNRVQCGEDTAISFAKYCTWEKDETPHPEEWIALEFFDNHALFYVCVGCQNDRVEITAPLLNPRFRGTWSLFGLRFFPSECGPWTFE